MNDKVKVISTIGGRIVVNVPEIPYKATWLSKGSVNFVKKDILEQLLYDNGFNTMIQEGMLYIEDMSVKKEFGLEPEDAKEPQNIIILSDAEKDKLLGSGITLNNFKKKVDSLSREQVMQLADYAIEKELGDFNKSEVIRKRCGKDVMNAIKLNHQDKE